MQNISYVCQNTVNGERFAGLNICCFSAIEVFMEILSRCLGHKEGRLYSQKSLCGTPENCEKHVRKFSPANLSPFMVLPVTIL